MYKLTILTALLLAALLPGVAPARDNPGVIKTGKCSNGASWKLKAKRDDARIEVEFEVDQNRNGVRWTVTLRRPAALLVRTTRVTRGPSGSFELRRVVGNRAGPDRIIARATRSSGEVCRAAATFG